VLLLLSLLAAVVGSGNPGITVQQGRITWLAPDGPAWSAGFAIGDHVVQQQTTWIDRSIAGPNNTLDPGDYALLAVGPALVLLALLLISMGSLVLLRARERSIAWRFFWLTLTAAMALGLVGAADCGYYLAIAGQEVALRLFGPSFLALAFDYPPALADGRPRRWIWVPALLVLVVYACCWIWPGALFGTVGLVDLALLAGYLFAGTALLVRAAFRPLSPVALAQLRLLCGGLILGLAPFVLGSLLPLLFLGHDLIPAAVSIMALVLLPIALAMAILRTEFLGITSLVHRRALRLCLALAGLSFLACAGLWLGQTAQDHGWSYDTVLAAAICASGLMVYPAYGQLVRRSEAFFLRDAYDLGAALLTLSLELSTAEPDLIGEQALNRLGTLMDLSFATFLEPGRTWQQIHPRSTVPPSLIQAVLEAGRAALAAPDGVDEPRLQRVDGLPILVLQVRSEGQTLATLCLGPKRSGDAYTQEDQVLLGTLARFLGVLLKNHALRAQLAGQVVLLRAASAERLVVAERVLTAVAEERRHVGEALYNEAVPAARLLAQGAGMEDRTEIAQHLVTTLERIAGDLAPVGHATPGLNAALHGLVRDTQRRTGIICTASVSTVQISLEEQAAIYQVAREAINNAIGHAQAQRITVELHYLDLRPLLRVQDDGIGFAASEPAHLLAQNKAGISLMRELAREVGGELRITSVPGQGSRVELALAERSQATAPALESAVR
jgi:GAF domain-containing protein